MVKSKLYHPTEVNESNIPTDRNKGQASNPKDYIGKKPRNKPSPKPEAKTDFQGWCTDFEGCIFYIGPRESKKISEQ